MSLRTFILDLDVLDWEPIESNIMQDTAVCCLKMISPSIKKLRLQFYLMDLRLARVDCLFSETRWTVLDYVLSCLPALETIEIALNVKVFIGHDEFVSHEVDEGFRRSIVERLSLTACECALAEEDCALTRSTASCAIYMKLNLPVADYYAPEMILRD